jgi:uncharacterized protein YdiU (UPF0061 family)
LLNFKHSYKSLGKDFYQTVNPAKAPNPTLILWNSDLANQLDLTALTDNPEIAAKYFSGNEIPDTAQPIALAYAGHQFGYFNPQLGDGRAQLLGELANKQGAVLDVQLKGSGTTMFSRNGDGRCGLKPAMREFIMSEALHALGVPTSRCLAVTTTGETIYRDQSQPGAVVTRVASSHIRVGTFQYFAERGDRQSLGKLIDFTIDRHYPFIDKNDPNKGAVLLDAIIERQIHLVCEWMRIGFIHGVMNTDNMAISGETLDFGPCAMMGNYSFNRVFSSIDSHGRYAFGNQPNIVQWNMARLAEAIVSTEPDKAAIEPYQLLINNIPKRFKKQYLTMYQRKLGLTEKANNNHEKLITDLLTIMEKYQLDYTQTFLQLERYLESNQIPEIPNELSDWITNWQTEAGQSNEQTAIAIQIMKQTNPVVIPRNHHMESVLNECISNLKNDRALQFLKVLQTPYTQTAAAEPFQTLPADGDKNYQTFCGT